MRTSLRRRSRAGPGHKKEASVELVNKRAVKWDEVRFTGRLPEPPHLEAGHPNKLMILKSRSKSPSPLDVTQLIIITRVTKAGL